MTNQELAYKIIGSANGSRANLLPQVKLVTKIGREFTLWSYFSCHEGQEKKSLSQYSFV